MEHEGPRCDRRLCLAHAYRVGESDLCPACTVGSVPGLRVHTIGLRRAGALEQPDLLDVTRGTGREGLAFAPSWEILRPAVAARTAGRDWWTSYVPAYVAEMRASYRRDAGPWRELLARNRVVLGCYCQHRDPCHRGVLARVLLKLGVSLGRTVIDCGEISPRREKRP